MSMQNNDGQFPYGSFEPAGNCGSVQTVSDVIRGMQYAVNTAQDTLQRHQYRLLEQYFDTETGKPECRSIALPDGRQVDIPLVTLIPANMLAIDELEMDFSLRVASSSVKKTADAIRGNADKLITEESERSSFNVYFTAAENDKEGGFIHIRMRFKSIPEPEAAARIREMLYSSVQ